MTIFCSKNDILLLNINGYRQGLLMVVLSETKSISPQHTEEAALNFSGSDRGGLSPAARPRGRRHRRLQRHRPRDRALRRRARSQGKDGGFPFTGMKPFHLSTPNVVHKGHLDLAITALSVPYFFAKKLHTGCPF